MSDAPVHRPAEQEPLIVARSESAGVEDPAEFSSTGGAAEFRPIEGTAEFASTGGLDQRELVAVPFPPAGPGGREIESSEDPATLEDWAWVEEWRAGREQVPWAHGVALAVFTGLVIASAVYVLSAGLSDRPIIAVVVNLIVAGGVAPAVWLARDLPVLRWIALGAVLGVVGAWISVLIFLTRS